MITFHPASVGRQLQSDATVPRLIHALHQPETSVLSLAANENYIFSGTQCQDISVSFPQPLLHASRFTDRVQVWDKKLFTLKHTLQGHTGSVLALEIAEEKEWLFSSSGMPYFLRPIRNDFNSLV